MISLSGISQLLSDPSLDDRLEVCFQLPQGKRFPPLLLQGVLVACNDRQLLDLLFLSCFHLHTKLRHGIS